MKTHAEKLSFALALLTLAVSPRIANAQGTAFTYQGQLASHNAPANGSFDFMFTLFNTNASGAPMAGPVTNAATVVSNGLFSATIDFGPGAFTGSNSWLELAVRTNGGANFTTLAPRQPVTPTPYALFANTASNLSGTIASRQLTGSIPANQVTGPLSLAQLPGVVVTNGASGLNLSGAFSGDGSSLTNLTPVGYFYGYLNTPYSLTPGNDMTNITVGANNGWDVYTAPLVMYLISARSGVFLVQFDGTATSTSNTMGITTGSPTAIPGSEVVGAGSGFSRSFIVTLSTGDVLQILNLGNSTINLTSFALTIVRLN